MTSADKIQDGGLMEVCTLGVFFWFLLFFPER